MLFRRSVPTQSTTNTSESYPSINLRAEQLSCERDDRCLFSDLSLQLSNGQLLQLVGANGAGKTTLLRILAGLNRDFDGSLFWQNQSLLLHYSDFAAQRIYIGHLNAVKPALTVMENLQWLCAGQSVSDAQYQEALLELDLNGYEETPAMHLSAGQQRRIALARLVACYAPLWILDEPFTALDKWGVGWLMGAIEQHLQRDGSVLITSHHGLDNVSNIRRVSLEDFAVDTAAEVEFDSKFETNFDSNSRQRNG